MRCSVTESALRTKNKNKTTTKQASGSLSISVTLVTDLPEWELIGLDPYSHRQRSGRQDPELDLLGDQRVTRSHH